MPSRAEPKSRCGGFSCMANVTQKPCGLTLRGFKQCGRRATMDKHETARARKLRHLREQERRAEHAWIAYTGRVTEHGPDTGYPVIDWDKRGHAHAELENIRREIEKLV